MVVRCYSMPGPLHAPPDPEALHRLCARCGKHPAIVRWVGQGGFLAYTHGMYSWWCPCCADREQLKYARKLARRIPKLERQLRASKRRCRALPAPPLEARSAALTAKRAPACRRDRI